jgi:hypothetical protein
MDYPEHLRISDPNENEAMIEESFDSIMGILSGYEDEAVIYLQRAMLRANTMKGNDALDMLELITSNAFDIDCIRDAVKPK